MTVRHFYRVADGHGLSHDPFKAIVGPRPIGWISSRSPAGVNNLAPYGFFNALSTTPPVIGFSSDGWKDSIENISRTGAFGWNLVSRPLAEAMNRSCANVAPDVDEFDLAGLEAVPGEVTSAPLVAGSPVSFECRLTQIVQVLDQRGTLSKNWLVMGEVVGVHIDRALVIDGVYDTAAADPVLRSDGVGDYFSLRGAERFVMLRPDGQNPDLATGRPPS